MQEADSEADRDSVPQVPLDFGKLHRPHNRDLNGEGRVYLKREEVDRTAELNKRTCRFSMRGESRDDEILTMKVTPQSGISMLKFHWFSFASPNTGGPAMA